MAVILIRRRPPIRPWRHGVPRRIPISPAIGGTAAIVLTKAAVNAQGETGVTSTGAVIVGIDI